MKKNVLFLLSRFLDGGIDTVLVEYVNALCSYTSHNITLAIGLDYGEAEVFLSRLDTRVKVVHIVENALLTYRKRKAHHQQKNVFVGVADELLLNPVCRCIIRVMLRRLYAANDVIVDFDSCFSAYIPKEKEGKIFVAFSHFSLKQLMRQNERRTRRIIRRWERYDKVVTICDAMLEEAREMCPKRTELFVRIYNSVNLAQMCQKADETVENPLIMQPYMLAIERLEESQKDLTTLIKAYANLVSNYPNAPFLYIIGEGRSRGELELLISDLGLVDRVRLLGFISNPYPWISKAELFVHSSRFEGFGMSVLEALVLGKLIVCTDCPTGPSEILAGGEAGLLTPVGDVEALARAMYNALTDKTLQQRLLAKVSTHSCLFMPEECARRFEESVIQK